MSKIIIENRSDLPDIFALDLVRRVMTGGRISNAGKQYCYATVFTVKESGSMTPIQYLKSKGWTKTSLKKHAWMLPKVYPYAMFTVREAILAQERLDADAQEIKAQAEREA